MKTHEYEKAKRTLIALAGVCALAASPLALAGNDAAAIMKDMHITQSQVDMVTAIQPTLAHDSALSVQIGADRGSGGTYQSGDKMRLAVEVSEDAYVWVYNTGTKGNGRNHR